ncbi:MAG: hypothetical protein AAF364_17175 [Pseudomonadota bacterium]
MPASDLNRAAYVVKNIRGKEELKQRLKNRVSAPPPRENPIQDHHPHEPAHHWTLTLDPISSASENESSTCQQLERDILNEAIEQVGVNEFHDILLEPQQRNEPGLTNNAGGNGLQADVAGGGGPNEAVGAGAAEGGNEVVEGAGGNAGGSGNTVVTKETGAVGVPLIAGAGAAAETNQGEFGSAGDKVDESAEVREDTREHRRAVPDKDKRARGNRGRSQQISEDSSCSECSVTDCSKRGKGSSDEEGDMPKLSPISAPPRKRAPKRRKYDLGRFMAEYGTKTVDYVTDSDEDDDGVVTLVTKCKVYASGGEHIPFEWAAGYNPRKRIRTEFTAKGHGIELSFDPSIARRPCKITFQK